MGTKALSRQRWTRDFMAQKISVINTVCPGRCYSGPVLAASIVDIRFQFRDDFTLVSTLQFRPSPFSRTSEWRVMEAAIAHKG